jgi:base plate protein
MGMMVGGLTPTQLLDVWERGLGRNAVEQALIILTAASDQPRDEVERLSLSRRDTLLLQTRAHTFGDALKGWVACPQCGERLEFTTDIAFIHQSFSISDGDEFDWHTGDIQLTMRLPNSQDLLAVGACADIDTARRQLLERCVQSIMRHDQGMAVSDLNETCIEQLVAQLSERDPQSETLLAMSCVACGSQWSALFDIGAFFWREIAAQAQRLLYEVHWLARAYSWREADILSMSARRRQSYLNLIEHS